MGKKTHSNPSEDTCNLRNYTDLHIITEHSSLFRLRKAKPCCRRHMYVHKYINVTLNILKVVWLDNKSPAAVLQRPHARSFNLRQV